MNRFLRTLLIFISPLILILGTMTAYYYFRIHPQLTGDLGQLGGIPFGTAYTDSISLPRLDRNKVVEYNPAKPCSADIITLGDSFGQQKITGYQNFMAHALGMEVLNIQPEKNPFQAAVSLLNNGFFDTHPPHLVVIETVERMLLERISEIVIDDSRSIENLISIQGEPESKQLTTASLVRYTFNWLLLQIQSSPVQIAPLDRPLFSLNPRSLYFYKDDLENTQCTEEQINRTRQTIEQIHTLFKSKGIRLIVVVAADKYDLYQKYIAENVFPTQTMLDELDAKCDTMLFVNTKRLLAPTLEKGVLDLYYANDTHWAQTGAQIVGEHLASMYQNDPTGDLP